MNTPRPFWCSVGPTAAGRRAPDGITVTAKTSAADLRAKVKAQVDTMLGRYNATITRSLYGHAPAQAATPTALTEVKAPEVGRQLDEFPSIESVGRK